MDTDPSGFVAPGGELPLSNLGQLELLRGMMERGSPLRTRVRGSSMYPLIRDGDLVTIAPVGEHAPRTGDVVAFVVPGSGRLAVHRVTASTDRGWVVRGDGCSEGDGMVTDADMLGRVVRVERGGRDVYFGGGALGSWTARLSRMGLLVGLKRVIGPPRRVLSAGLRAIRRAG